MDYRIGKVFDQKYLNNTFESLSHIYYHYLRYKYYLLIVAILFPSPSSLPTLSFFFFFKSWKTLSAILYRTPVDDISRVERYHHIIIWGGCFTIAFALLFVGTPDEGDVYGNAILW